MSSLPAGRHERIASGVLVVGALLFAGVGVARLAEGGGVAALTLPGALLGADVLIAVALLTGWYPVRPVAQGLAIFGALVHLLIALRSGPVWLRGGSAVLSAAHLYGLVLLFMLSAREEYDDEEAAAAESEEQGPTGETTTTADPVIETEEAPRATEPEPPVVSPGASGEPQGAADAPEQSDVPEQSDAPEQSDVPEQSDAPEQSGAPEQSEHADVPEQPEHADAPEQADASGTSAEADRPGEPEPANQPVGALRNELEPTGDTAPAEGPTTSDRPADPDEPSAAEPVETAGAGASRSRNGGEGEKD